MSNYKLKFLSKAVSGYSKEGACGIGMEMFCSEAQYANSMPRFIVNTPDDLPEPSQFWIQLSRLFGHSRSKLTRQLAVELRQCNSQDLKSDLIHVILSSYVSHSICLSLCLSVCLFVCVSVYICMSVYLSIYLCPHINMSLTRFPFASFSALRFAAISEH